MFRLRFAHNLPERAGRHTVLSAECPRKRLLRLKIIAQGDSYNSLVAADKLISGGLHPFQTNKSTQADTGVAHKAPVQIPL